MVPGAVIEQWRYYYLSMDLIESFLYTMPYSEYQLAERMVCRLRTEQFSTCEILLRTYLKLEV